MAYSRGSRGSYRGASRGRRNHQPYQRHPNTLEEWSNAVEDGSFKLKIAFPKFQGIPNLRTLLEKLDTERSESETRLNNILTEHIRTEMSRRNTPVIDEQAANLITSNIMTLFTQQLQEFHKSLAEASTKKPDE